MVELALVGDIGGTNSRFGLVEQGSTEVIRAQSLKNDNFASLEDAIAKYLEDQGKPVLSAAAIAVAAPVDREVITLTNRNWRFSSTSLAGAARVQRFILLNDYQALALALPHLTVQDIVLVGGVANDKREVKLVLGPGTGLGMAMLVPVGEKDWQAVPCESGHINLPIETQEEFDWRGHMQKPGVVFTAEDAITGGGLYLMYKTLDPEVKLSSPEQVLQAALKGTDDQAKKTLNQFLIWLMRIAGDVTMLLQARGGLYLAGGMAPLLIDKLRSPPLREIFEQKGKLAAMMRDIPFYVIVDPYPAFKGCIAALERPPI